MSDSRGEAARRASPDPVPRQRLHPFFDLPTPVVLGHRGAAAHVPENTIASFERALELGADIIESDVQMTRDGVPVLLHDADLARVSGDAELVEARSFEELRKVDAGAHFTIDDRGATEGASDRFRGSGLRIPSLREAFEALPRARFNLEVKNADPSLAREVVALVGELGRADRTLLAAADDAIRDTLAAEMAEQGVQAATSASISDVVACVRAAVEGEAPPAHVMALQIPTHFAGRGLVTAELVRHVHRFGVAVHVWTINESAEMERLLDLGADGLVTDFPGRAAAIAAARRPT